MNRELEFYFDFQSPYSYLAFNWLKVNKVLLEHLKIEIKYIPIFLGAVIKHYETKGPAEIEPKRNYLFKDCMRLASKRGIPFTPPKILPFNSLYVLRMVEAASQEKKFSLIEAFFSAGWEKGQDIGSEESLFKVLKENSFSTDLLEHCTSVNVRRNMKANFKTAIEKGVFGVPTFIFKNELFWGNDSTDHLVDFIRGEDQLNLKEYQYFLDNYFLEKNS